MKLVKQLDRFGCTIACAAMVLNRTYQEVKKDFKHDFAKSGISFENLIIYLGEQGLQIVKKETRFYHRINFARDEMLRPFAHAHVVLLRQTSDAAINHAVVMTRAGKLIDPREDTDYALRNSYEVLSTIGLFAPPPPNRATNGNE